MKYSSDVASKLVDIRNENLIWIIYIGIIFLSYYSNGLEKRYFIFNDLYCKEKYRKIIIIIFSILVIIYLYFFKCSIDDIYELRPSDSSKKKKLTELSAMGSLLIVISGIIFLYIAYSDQDIDVELAFN